MPQRRAVSHRDSSSSACLGNGGGLHTWQAECHLCPVHNGPDPPSLPPPSVASLSLCPAGESPFRCWHCPYVASQKRNLKTRVQATHPSVLMRSSSPHSVCQSRIRVTRRPPPRHCTAKRPPWMRNMHQKYPWPGNRRRCESPPVRGLLRAIVNPVQRK